MAPRRPALAAAALALALLAGAAQARGQLQVRQTSVELPPGVRGGRLVLANAGDAPVAAQVRLYAWTQAGGEDRLEPSQALAVSPAIAEIPPGGEQLVRVVRNATAPAAQEQAYRLVVDELPGDPGAEAGQAVQVRMRYLVPAFVRTADPAPAALDCALEPAALVCRNRGGRAAQLGASGLVARDGARLELTPGLLGYVLAGSTRRFALDAKALGGKAWSTLEVQLNGQPASIALSGQP